MKSLSSSIVAKPALSVTATLAVAISMTIGISHYIHLKRQRRRKSNSQSCVDGDNDAITKGGYESLIGNTPLLYLPHLSSLINKYHARISQNDAKYCNNDECFETRVNNPIKIFVKMENMNPGGTGKDRAARSMLLSAENRLDLPPPRNIMDAERTRERLDNDVDGNMNPASIASKTCSHSNGNYKQTTATSPSKQQPDFSNIDPAIHKAILIALHTTKTHGIVIEGTSGSTGISLASLASPRGHGVIVILPDDQSSQKSEFLQRLGCGVVVVKNCSISNPGHYVNVAKRVWELIEVERRYDDYYWREVMMKTRSIEHVDADIRQKEEAAATPQLLKAAFMNQFENLANVNSHYTTTGPEIYSQLKGKVDAFVMSAGTGGTLVGVGGYLKERWWDNYFNNIQRKKSRQRENDLSAPKIVLVDPPGSSLYNKIKYGVAYAPQQSEQSLRRHRYDTLAEGIGLDRVTANFGLGCEDIHWNNNGDGTSSRGGSFGDKIDKGLNGGSNDGAYIMKQSLPSNAKRIVDDAISITDQQAVYMAHYLLRHEGLFVGSSTAMNIAGALIVASKMPVGSNVVTVVCDGGQRHTSRFWNRDFVVGEWGLIWPGDNDDSNLEDNILDLLGISTQKA